MAPQAPDTRWERLPKLLSLLASRNVHSVAALSEQLGVSARTLARDLKLLGTQGYEIESSSGPGGGVRLSSDLQLRPLPLRMSEALELLLALAICEQAGFALFGQSQNLRSKLSRLFAADDRLRIDALRRRIRVATPAGMAAQVSAAKVGPQLNQVIFQAFFQQRLLNISYKNGAGVARQRVIEAQYLLVSTPFFYLIAWDQDLQEIRTFRNDRFVSATAMGDHFRLRTAAPFWTACLEVGVHV